MIKVDNLSYSFPEKELYNNISFTLEAGVHCALIGVSGSGKSTLLDLLMHPDNYLFEGKLEQEEGYRIGYVSQFVKPDETKDMTVFEYIGEKCIQLQNELNAICVEMETSLEIDALMEKYQETLDQFEVLGGHDFESHIHKQLNLADLTRHKDLMISELSGGEFKLIQVIKEMFMRPDLMIMDEPDVFLDFENLTALKDLINSYKGTLLVSTHSRYLLNHCFNKILHLENTQLQEFEGRYVDYNFSLLENKIELQELAAADTAEIERNQILIDQLREMATEMTDPSKGKSLRARMKIQERLEARRIKAPFVAIKEPLIQLPLGDELEPCTVLKVTDYGMTFDDVLLENVCFELQSTDKVALIGSNGTGKTTLLREIFKNNHPSIEINDSIKVAYLSQIQNEMLNDSHTLQEEFLEAGLKTYEEVAHYLADYGFEEEMLTQKISALSGGEKNILQLAKIGLGDAHLLLLDEPTSHLDTYAQLALEKAIQNYKGAVLMISHDFYTIANCADYVLIIENKTVRKMSMRKFRKMIYANHFDKDYLEKEQKKKAIETKIALALKNQDFETAKVLSKDLEALIKLL